MVKDEEVKEKFLKIKLFLKKLRMFL